MDTEHDIRSLCERVHVIGDCEAFTMDTVQKLLPWIASPNGELRDDLVYVSLCDVIEGGAFDQNELRWILDECLSDRYLFRGIDTADAENDDVFCRTFSLLIIDVVLDTQARHSLLPAQTLRQVWDRYTEYVVREKDMRGYVPGKGWAHSLAHGSDVAYSLIALGIPDRDDMLRLLEIWRTKLAYGRRVFVDEEGERVLRAVFEAYDRELISGNDMCRFAESLGSTRVDDSYPDNPYAGENLRNFLMCWHIHAEERDLKQLASATFQALQTLKHHRGKWY